MRVQRIEIMSVGGEERSPTRARKPGRPAIRLVTPPEPSLDPEIQAHIGEQLRAYYAELLSEPVPDRFVELVNRLDRKH